MNLKLSAVPILTASLTNVLPKYTAPTTPTGDIDGEIIVDGCQELGLYVKNLHGSNALNAFQIHGRFAKGGALVPIATVAGDYSTPNWPVRKASALVTLGAGIVGTLFMSVAGLYSVVLKAQFATANGTLDVEAAFN